MKILSDSSRQEGIGGDTLQRNKQVECHSQSLLKLLSILQLERIYFLLVFSRLVLVVFMLLKIISVQR